MDAVEEVHRLHEVIEAWFRGETDDLSPFADALAPEFRIVSPDGRRSDRGTVVANFRDAHGARADADSPFTIEVRNAETRAAPGDHRLVSYEEHQREAGDWSGRVSTVLLREAGAAPAGFEWIHLQETWLPD